MTQKQNDLIKRESERRFPLLNGSDCNEIKKQREEFILSTIISLSLNDWVSIKDRLPNKNDSNRDKKIWAWDKENKKVVIISYYTIKFLKFKYSHWRVIDLPTN